MFGRPALIYSGSFILHAVLALSVRSIAPAPARREPTKIVIREHKRPKPEKAPEAAPPPPPPPPPAAAPAPPVKAKAAPKPPPTAAPAPAAPAAVSTSAVPSFGLTLGGSVGGGGIAVAAAAPHPVHAPDAVRTAAPRSLVRPKPAAPAACTEPLVKPRPIEIPQPGYPTAAREAGISGKVRVELRVDATGRVVSARVIEGLGHGLDEAALEAARTARFEPATACGTATETSFVIGMRFNL